MSCIFQNCGSKKYNSSVSNIHFFKLPTIPYMREEWLKVCNVEENDLPREPLVCSLHFAKQDLKNNEKNVRVNRNAIPMSLSQVNDKDQYIEEYLEEYLDEVNQYVNGCALETSSISRKIIRKYYTSIGTQTTDSFIENQQKTNEQVAKLNEKIALLELELSSLKTCQLPLMELYSKSVSSGLKVPRYNLDDISFATSLYSAGPRSYKYLRKNNYPLPSPSTLRRWASKLSVEPGIQMQTLSHMKTSDLALEEKLCILSFDEMKCREEWAYDRKNDVIIEPKRMVQVAEIEKLNTIFGTFNGNLLNTNLNYMNTLLNLNNTKLDVKIAKRFFLGRTFFRIRHLNRNLKQIKFVNVNKKMKKITT